MIITWKRSATFIHTVTSGEATANAADLPVASGSAPTNDFYFIGQVRRSDTEIPGFKFTYTSGTGMLEVADAGSADLTEDDVIVVQGAWVVRS